ncbi:hypothetical protein [Pseudomonas juntendi]|uniref:hypothetical protein n=1 Tax=Pseudomonas juntendi TaxID=2666183 RepID=UPI001F2AAFF2|nr:hypothetical protein [Pseudomonas juntendi]MCO7058264.1 hypothetical protein [Pseudomonas juntendi]UJM15236.1 hypothetical protein L1P09_25825 [Pseudomonas juntendi]
MSTIARYGYSPSAAGQALVTWCINARNSLIDLLQKPTRPISDASVDMWEAYFRKIAAIRAMDHKELATALAAAKAEAPAAMTNATPSTDYLLINVDGTEERRSAELPADPGYRALADLVDPILGVLAWEQVTVLFNGELCDMFVDEVGAITGLPRNERATAIYRANALAQHPGTDPESLPAIYGRVVLFTRRVWF